MPIQYSMSSKERDKKRGCLLCRGKSQGSSDSDGGLDRRIQIRNNKESGKPTRPLTFHVPTNIVHRFVVEYSGRLKYIVRKFSRQFK